MVVASPLDGRPAEPLVGLAVFVAKPEASCVFGLVVLGCLHGQDLRCCSGSFPFVEDFFVAGRWWGSGFLGGSGRQRKVPPKENPLALRRAWGFERLLGRWGDVSRDRRRPIPMPTPRRLKSSIFPNNRLVVLRGQGILCV